MEEPFLIRHTENQIAFLTLNRPKRLNPLSTGMLTALKAEIDALADDRTVRCVVIRSLGRNFCAGHDLREIHAIRSGPSPETELKQLFDLCSTVMLGLRALPQPVIAQVQGLATAAGCQLVATCDMAIAENGARFGVNGVDIGLFCSTPMVALSRNIPRKQAFEMLTTGSFIAADQAVELGLINRAVAHDRLEAEVVDLATRVASKLSAALKIGKRAFYDQAEMSTAEAYAFTGDVIVKNMLRDDTAEGVAAFVEKRPPEW